MVENIIEIKNVSFSYDEESEEQGNVLENFSLEIERGSFVAILGHNGSGKSTLARFLQPLNAA